MLKASTHLGPTGTPSAPVGPTRPQRARDTLWELAYYSSASFPHRPRDLARLVRSAGIRNRSLGVTGMLVYWNQSFFQVLEGPKPAVESVFVDFIVTSKQHSGIIQAHAGTVEDRSFRDWSMACRTPSDAQILSIETLVENVRCGTGLDEDAGVGAALLKAFVASAGKELEYEKNMIL